MKRRVCSLSLDLDNQWSYMKTHGDEGWDSFPTYLDLVVPRFLEMLDTFDWKITVFVVGQDAALEKNHSALRLIVDSGHEIGNHSFHHEPWLHLYTEEQIDEEIERAEHAIEAAIQVRPRGFRGPGYSMSPNTLGVLSRRGYVWDASTFPTFLGPLARSYYFMTSSFSAKEKEQRKALFGGLRDGLRPLRPYFWDLERTKLLEIPVTTMPIFRIPIHFSYLLYIGTYSPTLAKVYFRLALLMCRMTQTEPSLLLHPLDFVGGDDVAELEFFPAMKMAGGSKLTLLHEIFTILAHQFDVESMGVAADRLHKGAKLRVRRP